MNSLISLAEARAAIRLPASDTSRDADLTSTYIPSVEACIVDLVGPVITTTFTRSFDGGVRSIVLDHTDVTIVSVFVNGLDYTGFYVPDLSAGILYRGASSMLYPYILFPFGRQNIVVTWTAGKFASVATIDPNYKLAARIILAHLWQADQQGNRPNNVSQMTTDVMMVTPSGFSVPRRAAQLLGAGSLPGFA